MPITEDIINQVGCQLGPYRLLERLGGGAMGAVFRVQVTNSTQDLALKLIHAPDDQRRHFESVVNEAMASSAVRHPNVVASLSYGADGDHLYIIMELAAGGDTDRLVKKEGCLTPEQAVEFAAQCTLGLEAIHSAGFIHRDLKPSNIMLDGDGRARIGDLGLGFPVAVAEQGHGIVGTPAYMAPEQARGEKLDARTDIFSMGATMYFWLTGRAPFQGRTLADTLRLAATGTLVDVRTHRPELSARIATVVHTAMATQKENRYPDARAFWQALKLVQEGSDPGPPPPPVAPPVALPDPHAKTEVLPPPVIKTSAVMTSERFRTRSWQTPLAVLAGAFVMALAWGVLGGASNPSQEQSDPRTGPNAAAKSYQVYSVSWVADEHLTFEERGDVRYARSGSEVILSAGAALVVANGSFLLEPLVAAGSFSVELSFWTEDLAQSGPARILACGLNHKLANLTIGQSGTRLEVRCRTTMTNTDGTRPSLVSQEGVLTPGWHHVVFVRDGELNQLWLDGVSIAAETVPGSLSVWDPTLPISIGDDPRGGFPWRGRVRKSVFFTRPLHESDISERFALWKSGK